MKRELSLGKDLMIHLEDEKGEIVTDRSEINEVATKFYEDLYQGKQIQGKEEVEITEGENEGTKEGEVLPFMEAEIEKVIQSLKNNKSPGHDGICNEHIKYGGEMVVKKLTEIFNEILEAGKSTEDWKKSDIILLSKKGSRYKVSNYWPVSLIPSFAKMLSKLIETRVRASLVSNQPPKQADFRSGFSTIDHLHTINLVRGKSKEYAFELHAAFIDYSKAFDSVDRQFLFTALKNQNIPQTLINLIEENVHKRTIKSSNGREGEILQGGNGSEAGGCTIPNPLQLSVGGSIQEDKLGQKRHFDQRGKIEQSKVR